MVGLAFIDLAALVVLPLDCLQKSNRRVTMCMCRETRNHLTNKLWHFYTSHH